MRALLDTHTFLWWNMDDPRLSEKASDFIADGSNEIFFSAASAWEIAIKAARGRLILPEPPQTYIAKRISLHHFSPLAVQVIHAVKVYELPEHHRDPFDRLLIAQCQLEGLPILTDDPNIARYPLTVIW